MSEEFEKLDRLIKLLKLTTSANDGEALSAMRRANSMLASGGWDWEQLLSGKVTIIADPFANGSDLRAPPSTNMRPRAKAKPPVQPQPRPQAQWNPPPRARPTPPPPRASAPPPKAPSGPVIFTKYRDNTWVIKSPTVLNESRKVDIQKKSGEISTEICGSFIEQDPNGYFLYRIGKASKWKHRYAGGGLDINDLV